MRTAGRIAGAVGALTVVVFVAAPAAQAATGPASAKAVPAKAVPAKAVPAKTAAATGPAVAALSAELANAVSGKVLWSKDASAERPMGSITKVMTAYVVIEAGNLNRVITVPKAVTAYVKKFDASTAGLVPGEKFTALQLLYALLIPSGCDAAYTLAVTYGPGWNSFIAKMNATAKKLGLTRTHFTDASGLPNPGNFSTYSTARDLVVLGRDAMKLAVFRQIVGLAAYHLNASKGQHPAFSWTNYNTLLTAYKGTIGIKTGQTDSAGACVLFEARRVVAGRVETLIGVVLHSSSFPLGPAVTDAENMLNWGFKHYS